MDHVFMFKGPDGRVMYTAHSMQKDTRGKTTVFEQFMPPDDEIKDMIKDGQKAYLDGKVYVPGKTKRPSCKGDD